MSDVLPKMRLYLFLSITTLLINLSIVGVATLSNSQTVSVDIATVGADLAIASGTSFIPFTSLINIATLNLVDIPMLLLFYTLIILIISAIAAFILAMVLLQIISNLFWSPDV